MSNSSHFHSPPPPNGVDSAATKRVTPPLVVPTGHASLRMLCHESLVGGFIGKSGSSIKHLQLETGSRIRVENSLQLGSEDRVIVIVAPNIPFKKIKLRKSLDEDAFEVEVSAVQEAALRVFDRVLEVSEEGKTAVLCRLLVGANEAGSVIGKGGKIVAKFRRESGAWIRVLSGGKLPSSVSYPDQVVEIEGDALAVKRALVSVCGQLQECHQTEKLSIKEYRPLESTTQSSVHDFRAVPLRQTPASVATTSYSPAMVGSSLTFEADVLPTSDLKLQQELVFRVLCPLDRVGGVIGRGGSIVHALQEESGASINIGSPVANCNERLITISSMENLDSRYSAAQRAVVLVHSRSIQAGKERGLEAGKNKGSSVSARLVVPTNQVGCLLGKGGSIISEIRKATGTFIHIHKGDKVPKCAAQDDEVVEISGQFVNTQDALYHITSRLRNNLFTSKAMNIPGSGGKLILDTYIDGRVWDGTPVGLHQSSGTSQSIGGQSPLNQGLDSLMRPHISHYSPSIGHRTLETAGVNPRNFMTFDRDLASTNSVGPDWNHGPAIVTNTTVEILVPESSISSVYGENESNLNRIRQISGAKVTVHDAVPGLKNRTVVISGTPDETQAAQSLVHAFILTGSS